MTNFKIFTNAVDGFDGKKIAIDITKITTIFQNETEDGKRVTSLWSSENMWTVKESFRKVLDIINEE